jgi:hypothetical protein
VEEAPIEREDVLVIMSALLRLQAKVGLILELLGEEGDEEEAEDDA